MALNFSTRLYLLIHKSTKRNVLLAVGSHIQSVVPAAYSSDLKTLSGNKKLNKAMKAYLERTEKFDNFLQQQLDEYNCGKEFLKSMMGIKSRDMTQAEIDEAIEYLLPSALYVPKARPMMKPPQEIFKEQKAAAFDASGRPFHFLFYTIKPNYSQCLHDAAKNLRRLNSLVVKENTSCKPMTLIGGAWLSKENLEKVFLEKLYDLEYEKLIEVFTTLANHPFASEAEDFIKTYWQYSEISRQSQTPTINEKEGSVKVARVEKLTVFKFELKIRNGKIRKR